LGYCFFFKSIPFQVAVDSSTLQGSLSEKVNFIFPPICSIIVFFVFLVNHFQIPVDSSTMQGSLSKNVLITRIHWCNSCFFPGSGWGQKGTAIAENI